MLGGSEEEEKVSANHETELSATKLLALREVTNDNHEKNIRLSSQKVVEGAKSSIKLSNVSKEDILRLNSP